MKQRQAGFTLMEMIILIVVLGILTATAAPKFLEIQKDARIAALKGGAGAVASAGQIVYGKAAIQGMELAASGAISTAGGSIDIVYGYPAATSAAIAAAVTGFGENGDFVAVSAATRSVSAASINFSLASMSEAARAACFFTYTQATSASVPSTKVFCGEEAGDDNSGTEPEAPDETK